MIFNRRTITKFLDLVNLQRHNDNYTDIQTDLTDHEGRITGAQSDITTHKASTAAHPAEYVTYSGAVVGAGNIQEAVDFVDERLDTIIVGGSEDKDPELTDIKTPDPSYTPGRDIVAAGDMVRDMQQTFSTQLADISPDESFKHSHFISSMESYLGLVNKAMIDGSTRYYILPRIKDAVTGVKIFADPYHENKF